MEYRLMEKMKWNISEIGFGAWAIGGDMWGPQNDEDSIRALHKAIDMGVNFIDTAQGYGNGHSEEIIGKVLKDREEEIRVATKVPPVPGIPWPPPDDFPIAKAFPKQYIIDKCENSLKKLDRDYLDIYQFHTWAVNFNAEDEWYEAVELLKQQGKIKAFGVSVPDTKPDSIIGSLVKGRIDSVQVIYNIFEQYPEWNLFPVCEEHGVAVIVRVPFDEGALTGKYNEDTKFPDGDVRNRYFRGNNLKAVVNRVREIEIYKNQNYPEVSMAEFALKFCLSSNAVTTVIPGIRNVEQAVMNTNVSDGNYLSGNVLNDLKSFAWRKDFWFNEVE